MEQRAKKSHQQGQGFGRERKGKKTHKQGKGFIVERKGRSNGMERVKGMERIGIESRALGKGYRIHGYYESQDVWQPCGQ